MWVPPLNRGGVVLDEHLPTVTVGASFCGKKDCLGARGGEGTPRAAVLVRRVEFKKFHGHARGVRFTLFQALVGIQCTSREVAQLVSACASGGPRHGLCVGGQSRAVATA